MAAKLTVKAKEKLKPLIFFAILMMDEKTLSAGKELRI